MRICITCKYSKLRWAEPEHMNVTAFCVFGVLKEVNIVNGKTIELTGAPVCKDARADTGHCGPQGKRYKRSLLLTLFPYGFH